MASMALPLSAAILACVIEVRKVRSGQGNLGILDTKEV